MSAHASVDLEAVGVRASIRCDDPTVRRYLSDHFGAMLSDAGSAAVSYDIATVQEGFRLTPDGGQPGMYAADVGALTYLLDSDLIVQLQLRRPDLLFLHAAVLSDERGAHLLLGRSGAGKSTTCWGLLQRGLSYMSDELAPIALADATVHAFPRAISMKAAPPDGFPLPADAVPTSRGFDVPVHGLPKVAHDPVLRVRTLLFVEYDAERAAPGIRPIRRAEAATRLYANVLNHLAHADHGLPAVLRMVAGTRAFVVDAAELGATCDEICEVLQG